MEKSGKAHREKRSDHVVLRVRSKKVSFDGCLLVPSNQRDSNVITILIW